MFRVARGNALTVVEPLPKPLKTLENQRVNKSAYIIVFQEGPSLRRRLTLLCDSFLGERFEFSADQIVQQQNETEYRISETKNILRFS